MWVNSYFISGDLSKSLLIHLFLLGCDTLPLSFFLLPNTSLVFSKALTAALTAPTLTLARAEVVMPAVALRTGDNYSCDTLRRHNLHFSILLLSLSPHCINNFYAIVAKAIIRVGELPEGDLAAMTRLLQ